MRRLLFSICLTAFISSASAQRGLRNSFDRKDVHHTVGIQINELIRAVFNFSGSYPFNNPSAFPTVNPYLLTYNINARQSGWGFRTGVGYFYAKQPQNYLYYRTEQSTTQIRARVGLEKAFRLSRRWSTGVGVDAVWNHDRNVYNTANWDNRTPPAIPDTTFSNSLTRSITLGGGPTTWLRYHITQRIQIGTEANFYYYGGSEQSNNEYRISRATGTSPEPRHSSFKDDIRLARLTLPVAFFLSVRF